MTETIKNQYGTFQTEKKNGRPTREIAKKKKQKKPGRKSVMSEDKLHKLEQAFIMGCNDVESCLYAGISKSAFYKYQDENPGYKERKETLRTSPALAARQKIANQIPKDTKTAQWYLERKVPEEFSSKDVQKHDISINLESLIDQIESKSQKNIIEASEVVEELPPGGKNTACGSDYSPDK